MGSDESHFNVSVGSDGQSHKTVSTNHNLFEEKGEPKRYRTEVLPDSARTDLFKLKRGKEQQCTAQLTYVVCEPELVTKPRSLRPCPTCWSSLYGSLQGVAGRVRGSHFRPLQSYR